MKHVYFSLIACSFYLSVVAQGKETPFHRGVNLTNWFQSDNVELIQFNRYSREDFVQIRSLGADVIRLPINLHAMIGDAPGYTIDPRLFQMLDSAVTWAEDLGIHLILDNHSFSTTVNTSPYVGDTLNAVWRQVASHYKQRGTYIYYEILNEPHGITESKWNSIQKAAVAAIRAVDSTHTIIVGGAAWNSYNSLGSITQYTDTNLIYTFHFYDPYMFTHQGASWTDYASMSGVPFPYADSLMPELPSTYEGTWVETAFNNYPTTGTTAAVQELIDIAVKFATDRDVPIFCGEFGAYMAAGAQYRVNWCDTVRTLLEARGISWATWEYQSSFGLFTVTSGGQFEQDLNVPLVEALGFTAPGQTTLVIAPDTAGRIIYDDFIGKDIYATAYNCPSASFMSTTLPNNDLYCLRWGNVAQYAGLQFDFDPNTDFSTLEAESYALDFMCRTTATYGSFDVRFIDTRSADSTDRPWRMSHTVTLAKDSAWHNVHIPLGSFKETGSYYGSWMEPQGLFDWTKVDILEIVAEKAAISSLYWFDNICITNQDTALVYASDTTPQATASPSPWIEPVSMHYAHETRSLLVTNAPGEPCVVEVFNILGQRVLTRMLAASARVSLESLARGIYVAQLRNSVTGWSTALKVDVLK